jgi:hypothetical protein
MARPITAEKAAVTFDTILIDDGRGKQRVSLDEFLQLPLGERVRLILGRKLEFWKGKRQIDRGAALKSLMDSMSKVSRSSQ